MEWLIAYALCFTVVLIGGTAFLYRAAHNLGYQQGFEDGVNSVPDLTYAEEGIDRDPRRSHH